MKKTFFILFTFISANCLSQNITSDSAITSYHGNSSGNYMGPIIIGVLFIFYSLYLIFPRIADTNRFTGTGRNIQRLFLIIVSTIVIGFTNSWRFSISFWSVFIPYTLLLLLMVYISFFGSEILKQKTEKYAPYVWIALIIVPLPFFLFTDPTLSTFQLIFLLAMSAAATGSVYFKYIRKKK